MRRCMIAVLRRNERHVAVDRRRLHRRHTGTGKAVAGIVVG
jgi:hypothetical protein